MDAPYKGKQQETLMKLPVNEWSYAVHILAARPDFSANMVGMVYWPARKNKQNRLKDTFWLPVPLIVDKGAIAGLGILEVELAQAVPQHSMVPGQHLRKSLFYCTGSICCRSSSGSIAMAYIVQNSKIYISGSGSG
jgi:hypothetical protein